MKQQLFLAGILSGVVLGVFLKIVEQVTGKYVYTLLLNIDYFPVVGNWEIKEPIEFALHLVVSVILVFVLYVLFRNWQVESKLSPYLVGTILIGFLLYPTTVLSDRTPYVTDWAAFLFWISGHAIYGMAVWLFIYLFIKRKDLDETT